MNKIVTVATVATLFLVLTLVLQNNGVNAPIVGNVVAGGELQSTTTSNTFNTPAETVGGFKILACGAGMLGSVNLTNETTGSFTLYDATSTRNAAVVATDGSTVGSTTLAKIYASTAEGNYAYNSRFKHGLIVEFQSPSIASSTITYRGNPVCNN